MLQEFSTGREKCPTRVLFFIFTLFISFLFSGCLWNDTGELIYILSRSEDHKIQKAEMPEVQFQIALANTVQKAQKQTLLVLNEKAPDTPFALTELTLGLGLEASVGIKNILDVNAQYAFELHFQPLPPPSTGHEE